MSNLMNVRHAYPLMLKTDTIDYIKWIAKGLSVQRNQDVSVSEAVEYLVQRHWIKMQKANLSRPRVTA